MKPTLLLLVTIGIATCARAQTTRLYFDGNMNAVTDSTKAASKVILSRCADDTTLWAASQYTMDNSLTVEGVYKDRDLAVPHGPFKYYLNISGKNYLAHSGSFFNGAKFGEWIDYYPDGRKKMVQTFRNNVLNGPYVVYSPLDTTPTLKGNFLKGKRNGEWAAGWGTEIYEDGVLVKTIPGKEYLRNTALLHNTAEKLQRQEHMTAAIEPVNFGKFMQQRLASYFRPYFDKNAGTAIILTFTVTAQGKLTNGRSLTIVSDDVQQQVARAIDTAPYWVPAELNGKPISQKINYTFVYDNIR